MLFALFCVTESCLMVLVAMVDVVISLNEVLVDEFGSLNVM